MENGQEKPNPANETVQQETDAVINFIVGVIENIQEGLTGEPVYKQSAKEDKTS